MKANVTNRRQRRPAERPDEIASAALTLFCERGYYPTTIDDVAAAAGVTKGAVYHHFDSKEQLLETAMESFLDQAIERAKSAMTGSDPSDVVNTLRIVLRAAAEMWISAEFSAVFCLVFGDVGKTVPGIRRTFLAAGPLRGWAAVAELIRRGQTSGKLRTDVDAHITARSLACALALQSMLLRASGYSKPRLMMAIDETLDVQLTILANTTRESPGRSPR
jgi:AcrR family transcriptional regulator